MKINQLKPNILYTLNKEYYILDNQGFLMVWIDGKWKGSRLTYNQAMISTFEEVKYEDPNNRGPRIITGESIAD